MHNANTYTASYVLSNQYLELLLSPVIIHCRLSYLDTDLLYHGFSYLEAELYCHLLTYLYIDLFTISSTTQSNLCYHSLIYLDIRVARQSSWVQRLNPKRTCVPTIMPSPKPGNGFRCYFSFLYNRDIYHIISMYPNLIPTSHELVNNSTMVL